jgi:hypothetical protein
MTTRLFASPYGARLRDERVGNYADADAEIPAVLAGRNRFLWEMATAGPAEPTGEMGIARNPQGLYGVDCSGPPYGSAMRHTLVAFSGRRSVSGSSFTRAQHFEFGGTERRVLVFHSPVWVKAFPAHVQNTPYSRGYVTLRGANTTTDPTTITLKLSSPAMPSPLVETVTFPGTTVATYTLAGWLGLAPGRCWVKIEVSSSSAIAESYLDSLSVSQIVKRGH